MTDQEEHPVTGQKTKSVLVCIGNVNRPITFSGAAGSARAKNALIDRIKITFADIVMILNNSPLRKPIYMVKNEKWRNEFVDIGDSFIPDRAVVRVVEAVSSLIILINIRLTNV